MTTHMTTLEETEALVRKLLNTPIPDLDALMLEAQNKRYIEPRGETLRFAILDVLDAMRNPSLMEEEDHEWPRQGALK